MKLLAFCSLLLLLALPIVLLVKRRMNVSLSIFYSLLLLFILGGMGGTGGLAQMSGPQILGCVGFFAVTAGIEFTLRQQVWLGVFTAFVLLLFAAALYGLAAHGAFA